MPILTCYTKSLSSDFPNGKVNTSLLTTEIGSSSISISLSHIDTEGDNCYISFKDVLSPEDESTLNNIVDFHTGENLTNDVLKVHIDEEYLPTGGHFCTKSIVIYAEPGTSSTLDVFWPYPITALTIKLTTDETSSSDTIDMSVGANTTVGYLTLSSGFNAELWTNKNYIKGDKVLYTTSPVYGQRVYTCINSTNSAQSPDNNNYWRAGYELSVNSTVLSTSNLGYYITLSNGSADQDMGRLIYKTGRSIFVENVPNINFLALDTYVKQTVYVLKDHYIGNGKAFTIGEGKIGGSYVPTDVIVNVKYTNNSSVAKHLYGFVEYLY